MSNMLVVDSNGISEIPFNLTGVYQIYFPECERYYIGRSNDIRSRLSSHISELNKKNHYNNFLQNVFNKYQHFVIFIYTDVYNEIELEQKLLDFLFDDTKNMNLSPSSEGGGPSIYGSQYAICLVTNKIVTKFKSPHEAEKFFYKKHSGNAITRLLSGNNTFQVKLIAIVDYDKDVDYRLTISDYFRDRPVICFLGNKSIIFKTFKEFRDFFKVNKGTAGCWVTKKRKPKNGMEVYYYDEYLRSIAREQPTFMGQSKIGA